MSGEDVSWMKEAETKKASEWTHERDSKASEREKNKRARAIYEDEGMTYGAADVSGAELSTRLSTALKLRTRRIADVMAQIRKSRNVELCFLVDATGSMQPHIDGVRLCINTIVDNLTGSTSKHVSFPSQADANELKLAMVAYRDHCDGARQFEVLHFGAAAALRSFCAGISADGGGADGPEDVFGGLDRALALNWSDKSGSKAIFHIADAPCHGREFHEGMADGRKTDDYPDGDPKGRTHTALFKRLRDAGIQYHFGKINWSTDIMLRKFEQAYGEPIVVFDVKDPSKITEAVTASVRETISTMVKRSIATGGRAERTRRDFTISAAEPDWARMPAIDGKFLTYELPKSIEDVINDVDLERKQPKTAKVQIAGSPFAAGAERIAYYGRDVSEIYTKMPDGKAALDGTKDEHIVVKEYLHKGPGMNSAKRYELTNQMQSIASYLAQRFVDELRTRGAHPPTVKFMKVKTFANRDGTRYVSCERRFARTDKFVRFSNNADYVLLEAKARESGVTLQQLQAILAFSHWTYQATKKQLMVVDLEGIVTRNAKGEDEVLLTDPAIHCADKTRFGPMNHGEEGFKNFFARHECNEFCKTLALTGL